MEIPSLASMGDGFKASADSIDFVPLVLPTGYGSSSLSTAACIFPTPALISSEVASHIVRSTPRSHHHVEVSRSTVGPRMDVGGVVQFSSVQLNRSLSGTRTRCCACAAALSLQGQVGGDIRTGHRSAPRAPARRGRVSVALCYRSNRTGCTRHSCAARPEFGTLYAARGGAAGGRNG